VSTRKREAAPGTAPPRKDEPERNVLPPSPTPQREQLAERALLEIRRAVWNFIAMLRALGHRGPADFLERALLSNIEREVHGNGGAA
jgi:hypothetical protein